RPLGLHLLLHQDPARAPLAGAARAQPGDDDPALPQVLLGAVDPDLPSPRRARHGRHGRADPDQQRRRSERARAGPRARRQAARGHRRPRRHLGRASGADPAGARGVRRAHADPAPAAHRARGGDRHRARPAGAFAGHDHADRLREQRRGLRALPRRLARRQRLRADPLADGGRRHRRDRAGAAVAMAACRRRRVLPAAPGRRHGDRRGPVRPRAAVPAFAPGRAAGDRRGARARGDRDARGADPSRHARGLPDPARLRAHLTRRLAAPRAAPAARACTPFRIEDIRMNTEPRTRQIDALQQQWDNDPRWTGIQRPYSAADVVRLRGSLQPEYTLAKRGAEKLWKLVNGGAKKGDVNAFGAISAGQAMQQAKAGLEAVYLSGWQVAADGNTSETMYPDQSLYAYDSVPTM